MNLRGTLYSVVPPVIRIQGRSFFKNLWLDQWQRWRGTVDDEVPPRHLNISGDGDFRAQGQLILEWCRSLGHLRTTDMVLDIGCGIGRTALALTTFLQPPGGYVGMDAVKFAIKWCEQHLARQHPNFRFLHSDVCNHAYNPTGRIRPEDYRFPLNPGSFHFALATSLFTHVQPASVANYIQETSRVLGSDGRFLSTWFLLDDRTEAGQQSGAAMISFPHKFSVSAQRSLHAPEQAVAYRTDFVKSVLQRSQFAIEGVYYGRWSGLSTTVASSQDIIVARRL